MSVSERENERKERGRKSKKKKQKRTRKGWNKMNRTKERNRRGRNGRERVGIKRIGRTWSQYSSARVIRVVAFANSRFATCQSRTLEKWRKRCEE